MKYPYMHPREQLVTIMRRVYGYGMTTTSGGNISILDDTGDIWITPGGIDKGGLQEADIVRMRGDVVVEGTHPPSSEYPFHRAIYARRPDIRAVLHAHPAALVAFSLVRKIPDTASSRRRAPSAASSALRHTPSPVPRRSAATSPMPSARDSTPFSWRTTAWQRAEAISWRRSSASRRSISARARSSTPARWDLCEASRPPRSRWLTTGRIGSCRNSIRGSAPRRRGASAGRCASSCTGHTGSGS